MSLFFPFSFSCIFLITYQLICFCCYKRPNLVYSRREQNMIFKNQLMVSDMCVTFSRLARTSTTWAHVCHSVPRL